MSDELIQRVLKTIAASKRIPPETVTIDSTFQQLGIDSMDAVEILFALENEFDISIPDEKCGRCATCARCAKAWSGWWPPSATPRPASRCGASRSPGWARSARWAGTAAEFAASLRAGRSASARSNPPTCSQLRFQNGAEVQGYSPHALFRRPPRRLHGPLRAVRGDRRARGGLRCGQSSGRRSCARRPRS